MQIEVNASMGSMQEPRMHANMIQKPRRYWRIFVTCCDDLNMSSSIDVTCPHHHTFSMGKKKDVERLPRSFWCEIFYMAIVHTINVKRKERRALIESGRSNFASFIVYPLLGSRLF